MSARKATEFVAITTVEVPPGSGMVAYVYGDPVTTEAVHNLGLTEEQVRYVGQPRQPAPRSAPSSSSSPSPTPSSTST